MTRELRQILSIKASVGANTVLYFLKRLPLIKRAIPESVYYAFNLKTFLSVVAWIASAIKHLFTTVLYFVLLIVIPVFWVSEEGGRNFTPEQLSAMMVHLLFFLSGMMAPTRDSEIFRMTREKVVCIRYMRMNPRHYVQSALFMGIGGRFGLFLPLMLIMFSLTGGTIGQAFFLWLVLLSFGFMGEAIQLWVYTRTSKVLSRVTPFAWTLIGICCALAYAPLAWAPFPNVAAVILHPAFVLGAVALGLFCAWYVLFRYNDYYYAIKDTFDTKYLYSEAVKAAKKNTFADVAVKETDLLKEQQRDAREGKQSAFIERLHGYAYLNALFFKRHRRQLLRPLFIRLAIIGVGLVAGIVGSLISPDKITPLAANLPKMMPVLVFVMYLLCVADKACRAMFYNCDISLLRYGFYRRPRVILDNFRIRLLQVSMTNLTIGGTLAAALMIITCVAGGSVLTFDFGMMVLTILSLTVFFSVHQLFMYYVFQPYTTELNVKNPFFQIINSIVYFLCFISLQIETASSTFTLMILGITIVYILVALLLVYRFAPRTFRVK